MLDNGNILNTFKNLRTCGNSGYSFDMQAISDSYNKRITVKFYQLCYQSNHSCQR